MHSSGPSRPFPPIVSPCLPVPWFACCPFPCSFGCCFSAAFLLLFCSPSAGWEGCGQKQFRGYHHRRGLCAASRSAFSTSLGTERGTPTALLAEYRPPFARSTLQRKHARGGYLQVEFPSGQRTRLFGGSRVPKALYLAGCSWCWCWCRPAASAGVANPLVDRTIQGTL